MQKTRLIFLGGGNMAEAIFSGLVNHHIYEIIVIQRNQDKLIHLTNVYPNIVVKPILDFTTNCRDIVFLAIKPQQAKDALLTIKHNLQECTIVSVMAGVTIESIQTWLSNPKIIRTMPNTPSSIAKGVTAIFNSPKVSQHNQNLCNQIFSQIGSIYIAKTESEIDKIAPFTSSSIAFSYYFIEGLINSASQNFGFDKKEATQFIIDSVIGACELLKHDQSIDIETRRNQVTSKKGMTEQGLLALQKHNLHHIIAEATQKCYNRAIEMSHEFK